MASKVTRRRVLTYLTLGSLGAVGGTALGVWRGSSGSSTGGQDADFVDFASLKDLVEASDLIVRGNVVAERQIVVGEPAADGVVRSKTTELVRMFKIVEVLKGDVKPESLAILETVSSVRESVDQDGKQAEQRSDYEVLKLDSSAVYVAFLRGIPRPSLYPAELGDVLWARPGEPGIARESGSQLEFLATRRYFAALSENGLRPLAASREALRETIAVRRAGG